MTVKTNNVSLFNFRCYCFQSITVLNHIGYVPFLLTPYVIESQNFNIAFSAISARFLREVFEYKPSCLFL